MGAYALSAAAQAGDWLINLDDTVVALVNAFVARLILTFWVHRRGARLAVLRRAARHLQRPGQRRHGVRQLDPVGRAVGRVRPLARWSIRRCRTSSPPSATRGPSCCWRPILLAVATLAMTMSGRWSLTLARRHAGLRVAVDDLPAVDQRARGDRRAASVQSAGARHRMGDRADHPGHAGGGHLRPLTPSPITRRRACCAATGATPS